MLTTVALAIFLSLVAADCPASVWAFVNPARTVAECPDWPLDTAACQKHCHDTYAKNIRGPVLAEFDSPGQPKKCCCLFDVPWPEFIDPKSIGMDVTVLAKKDKHDWYLCKPIVLSIAIRKDTSRYYDTLCKYFDIRKPMTILELIESARALAHLKYMNPRHPFIQVTLRDKRFKHIDQKSRDELQAALFGHLLDDTHKLNDWSHHPGYHFNTERFAKMKYTLGNLTNSLKSQLVRDAIDELFISQTLFDLEAATNRVTELDKYFKIPTFLLEGKYDRYFRDRQNYFSLEQVDCKSLDDALKRIRQYLSQMERTLEKLPGKTVYHRMKDYNPHLKKILLSKEIYENVFEINCKPASLHRTVSR